MLRRNVLIFHLGALGDFILTWPFALALSRIYPQSRVIFVTHGEKGQLAEKVLRLESSDVETGWHGLFNETPALPERAEKLLLGAHAIYTFLSPTPIWLANVNRLNSLAKLVAMEPKPPADFSSHASQWLLEQLKDHPIERAATEQILRSVADRGVGFTRKPGRDILIHPGSGSPAKCWPLVNFLELAAKFKENGTGVRFLIGEVERERWSSSDLDRLGGAGELREPKSYAQLLVELSTAAAFIGNDSGPGHLAGIIGVPTFSIFTSTKPEQWQPLGPRVQAVSAPTVDQALKLAMGLIN
jgi:ADP-heptose:LPS heptosyltransferase